MPILDLIAKVVLIAGLVGLLSSSAYTALVLFAITGCLRRRRKAGEPESDFFPPVSLLKPLHGDEPELEGRIEGFFQQGYPNYEVLFCARESEDAGLNVARKVAARFPQVPVQFLAAGESPYANAKVFSLEFMTGAAQTEIFVISDSDVRVSPEYLREVVAPFSDPKTGLVTCLYRGVAEGKSFWSRLEATAMSIEMAAGVLVAERMEGMKFALGPTMAVRRACVEEIGGFGSLGRYCADDFVLGNRIAEMGHRVVLSDHVIDHIVLNESFVQSLKHQVRWMKSTRFSRPKGHLGTALTFSLPFGVLVCVAAIALGIPLLGLGALLWSIAARLLLAAAVGGAVVEERNLLQTMLLYPIRDLMGFGFWAASYLSSKVLWRGEIFELLRDGVMRRYPAAGESGFERG